MAHPQGTNARLGQTVIEPGRGSVAKVSAQGLMDWAEDLEEDEHAADEGQRGSERPTALHRADEHAHGNGENGGQRAAQQQDEPPQASENRVGPGQDAEELPLVAPTQPLWKHRTNDRRWRGVTRGQRSGRGVILTADR